MTRSKKKSPADSKTPSWRHSIDEGPDQHAGRSHGKPPWRGRLTCNVDPANHIWLSVGSYPGFAAGDPIAGIAADGPSEVKLRPGDKLPRDRWIDALKYVDPSWDAVSGDWRREDDALITEAAPMSRLTLPFDIDGSYEILAEFTRRAGDDAITVILPVGQRSCQVILSGWRGAAHGLRLIDGVEAYEFDNPATFRPGKLVNKRRYRAVVAVQIKEDNASIDVSLDGQAVIQWTGKQKSLSIAPQWGLPYAPQAGIGACDSTVIFHRVSVRSISGKSRRASRPAPPFQDVPNDHWIDLLNDVDPQRDAVQGAGCEWTKRLRWPPPPRRTASCV